MIFGKEYDQSLWLMLYGAKKNRGYILGIIEHLPKDFIENIRVDILTYQRYIDDKSTLLKIPLRYEMTKGNMYYSYLVDKETGILNIRVSNLIDGEKYYNRFLVIEPINIKKCRNMIECDDYPLGVYAYKTDTTDFDYLISSEEICYEYGYFDKCFIYEIYQEEEDKTVVKTIRYTSEYKQYRPKTVDTGVVPEVVGTDEMAEFREMENNTFSRKLLNVINKIISK